ncbi:MAG: LysR family transcriptional regulator [Lawsonibacter sp.]|nr:LysR family transcriptional regulator [Lawsonibacter sp.]
MKLQYFISTARHLNFTKAAAECHVSQTVISRQIASLEDELGLSLFFRNKQRVELTPVGADFYRDAVYLLQYQKAMVDRLHGEKNSCKGVLKIGVGPYEEELIQKLLLRFVAIYPEINVSCWMFSYEILPFRFNRGLVDVAFTTSHCALSFQPVQVKVVFPPHWVLMGKCDLPFWDNPNSNFDTENVIIQEDMATDAFFQQCAASGFKPKCFLKSNFYNTQRLMADAGCGLALIPEYCRLLDIERSIPLPARDFVPEFVVAHNPENHNPALAVFLNYLQENGCSPCLD